jgi:hypothetical protein
MHCKNALLYVIYGFWAEIMAVLPQVEDPHARRMGFANKLSGIIF